MNIKNKIQKLFEKQKIITFIDIASNEITCAMISFKEDNSFKLLGFAKSKSYGVRQGAIVDIKQVVQSLGEALESVEKQSDIKADKVVVSCLLPHSKHIVYPYSNNIDAVVDNDKLYSIFHPDIFKSKVDSSNFMLHLFAENILFDDVKIDNPNGLYVDRIVADVHIVTVPYAGFINLMEILNFFALSPEVILYSPLASGYGAISQEEAGLATLSVEVSYDSASYCLFKDDILISTGYVPLGVEFIVKELAKELNLNLNVATKLFDYYSNEEERAEDTTIQISHNNNTYSIQSSLVDYKVKQGFKKIFNEVNKKAMKASDNKLLDKIILTGMGASYKGIEDICKDSCSFINYSSFNIVTRKPAKNKNHLSYSDNVLFGMIKYYLNGKDFDFGMRYFTENIEKKLMK